MRYMPLEVRSIWFAYKVRPGGPWDYKRYGKEYEDFGNFHYGAVGSAVGYAPIVLEGMAGVVQQKTNMDARREGKNEEVVNTKGIPFFGYPNGDSYENGHSHDQDVIRNGIGYYNYVYYSRT